MLGKFRDLGMGGLLVTAVALFADCGTAASAASVPRGPITGDTIAERPPREGLAHGPSPRAPEPTSSGAGASAEE